MLADPLQAILSEDEYLEMQAEALLAGIGVLDVGKYRFDPAAYIEDYFGWTPWSGGEHVGQQEIIDAYVLALRQQHERYDYNNGFIDESALEYWQPGQTIQTIISIDAGHSVGKTKLCSGLLNHFFDCFIPSIIYSFAPSEDQIKDLLWKEIKSDRERTNLPGRILDLRLDRGPDHFAKGRATSNTRGTGTERAQGQHGDYLMFVVDEAEGVESFVFDAIDSMASGGIAHIVLVARNPRTSSCRAHKIRKLPTTNALRISCLHHPNVVHNRDIVPASVTRRWVDEKIDEWCNLSKEHNPDLYTFEVPWRDGIFEPADQRFLWRVMGIVGGMTANDVFVPVARYEAACNRDEPLREVDDWKAQLGIDCARFGDDVGTGWTNTAGYLSRYAEFTQADTLEYFRATKAEIERLKDNGCTHVTVNVDGGGGFGGGVTDLLRADADIYEWFQKPAKVEKDDKREWHFIVNEVHFGGKPDNEDKYADKSTEIYAQAAERLKEMVIKTPLVELEEDLTQRKFIWAIKGLTDVRRIEKKEHFKKRVGRSPDNGDGAALALAKVNGGKLVLW